MTITLLALFLFTAAAFSSPDWQGKYVRMKHYARKQEKLRGVQYREIRKLRAIIRGQDKWWVPAWWLGHGGPHPTGAICIHLHESTDWHQKGHHRGGMQFLFSTWASVGGRGDPADASPSEQIYRAYLVWKRDGMSWREWSTRGMCGLA